jgi:hypothetical protein
MRLVYEDTGTPVEIGDELKLDDEEYTVVGIDKPKRALGNGRVNCQFGYGTYSWFPYVIGAIWQYEDESRTGTVDSSITD